MTSAFEPVKIEHPVLAGTFKVAGVLVSGCLWTLAGFAVVLAALPLAAAAHSLAEGLVVAFVGVGIMFLGVGFLTARIEVTHRSVVIYWGLHRSEHPLDTLSSVVVAEPKRRSASWVSHQYGTPNGLFTSPSKTSRALVATLATIWIPGTGFDASLNLMPRFGTPIAMRAISSHLRDNQDFSAAFIAVQNAIGAWRARHPIETQAPQTKINPDDAIPEGPLGF